MREDEGTFDNMLETCGYKLTAQRQKVLEVIIKNRDGHLSVEEIFDELKKSNLRIGLATVYRTINLFEEIGFVQHVANSDGNLRYQIIDPEEKREHHHLICESCGDVIDVQNAMDIPKNLLEIFERRVFFETGFTITHQKVQFYGKCKKCSKELDNNKSVIS